MSRLQLPETGPVTRPEFTDFEGPARTAPAGLGLIIIPPPPCRRPAEYAVTPPPTTPGPPAEARRTPEESADDPVLASRPRVSEKDELVEGWWWSVKWPIVLELEGPGLKK